MSPVLVPNGRGRDRSRRGCRRDSTRQPSPEIRHVTPTHKTRDRFRSRSRNLSRILFQKTGMMRSLESMRTTGELCDVFLVPHDDPHNAIPAHKVILAAASDVYRNIFNVANGVSRSKVGKLTRKGLEGLVCTIYQGSFISQDRDEMNEVIQALEECKVPFKLESMDVNENATSPKVKSSGESEVATEKKAKVEYNDNADNKKTKKKKTKKKKNKKTTDQVQPTEEKPIVDNITTTSPIDELIKPNLLIKPELSSELDPISSTQLGCPFPYETDLTHLTEPVVFDSHCHLDRITNSKMRRPIFKKDFGLYFEGCISVFCDPIRWRKPGYMDTYLSREGVYGIVGCHPNSAYQFDEPSCVELEARLKVPKIVGIGEIGLDWFKNTFISDKERLHHEEVFRYHLKIAKKLNLPICLHVRKAADDAARILKESDLSRDWKIHMHCFTDDWRTCQKWMKKWPNMKFGFVPDKFYTQVVTELPLDRILLETDSPYFVPDVEIKYRKAISGTGHCGYVVHIAAQIARLKNIPIEMVLEANRRNIKEIYGI